MKTNFILVSKHARPNFDGSGAGSKWVSETADCEGARVQETFFAGERRRRDEKM